MDGCCDEEVSKQKQRSRWESDQIGWCYSEGGPVAISHRQSSVATISPLELGKSAYCKHTANILLTPSLCG